MLSAKVGFSLGLVFFCISLILLGHVKHVSSNPVPRSADHGSEMRPESQRASSALELDKPAGLADKESLSAQMMDMQSSASGKSESTKDQKKSGDNSGIDRDMQDKHSIDKKYKKTKQTVMAKRAKHSDETKSNPGEASMDASDAKLIGSSGKTNRARKDKFKDKDLAKTNLHADLTDTLKKVDGTKSDKKAKASTKHKLDASFSFAGKVHGTESDKIKADAKSKSNNMPTDAENVDEARSDKKTADTKPKSGTSSSDTGKVDEARSDKKTADTKSKPDASSADTGKVDEARSDKKTADTKSKSGTSSADTGKVDEARSDKKTAATKSKPDTASTDSGKVDESRSDKKTAATKSKPDTPSTDSGKVGESRSDKKTTATKSKPDTPSADSGKGDEARSDKKTTAIKPKSEAAATDNGKTGGTEADKTKADTKSKLDTKGKSNSASIDRGKADGTGSDKAKADAKPKSGSADSTKSSAYSSDKDNANSARSDSSKMDTVVTANSKSGSTNSPDSFKKAKSFQAEKSKDAAGSNKFIILFIVAVIAFGGLYVIYHNKKKILACIVEGRRVSASDTRSRTGSRRTSGSSTGSGYKLVPTDEQALLSNSKKPESVQNFIY